MEDLLLGPYKTPLTKVTEGFGYMGAILLTKYILPRGGNQITPSNVIPV
jgi:hypothetical protein